VQRHERLSPRIRGRRRHRHAAPRETQPQRSILELRQPAFERVQERRKAMPDLARAAVPDTARVSIANATNQTT